MKLVFVAGKWVTIDESGFWWLGKDGQWHHDGMPHVTKIIRKPRSVMAELKTLCDAISGIMIAVELQEGKDAMKAKEFASEMESRYRKELAKSEELRRMLIEAQGSAQVDSEEKDEKSADDILSTTRVGTKKKITLKRR